MLSRTVFGRYAAAIGTNEEAVRLSGIDPKGVQLAVFTISGACAGLAGIVYTARLSSADPNAAVGFELQVIAAVVVGGTSLMGGRASVAGSFLGVLIIAVLGSGLAQAGAQEPTKRLVTGAVIVAADLKLVVTDFGDTVYRARVAARLLEVAGRADVPVGIGLRQSEEGGPQAEWALDYDLESYPGTVHQDGVQAMIDLIRGSETPITVAGRQVRCALRWQDRAALEEQIVARITGAPIRAR